MREIMNYFGTKKRAKIAVATTISASGIVKAGGSNVVHGLYTSLAEYFDIEVIFIAPEHEEFRRYQISPGLFETVVPKTKIHVKKELEITRKLHAITTYDLSLMYFLEETPQFGEILQETISSSDLVIMERPYLYREVKKYLAGRPLFQRSQNIEYYFRKATLPETDDSLMILNDLFELEKESYSGCDVNYACSMEDLDEMQNMFEVDRGQLVLLSNGVSCKDNPYVSIDNRICYKRKFTLSDEKIAIFIGGGNRPNVEACEMILNVAEYCQSTKFLIAGAVCAPFLNRKKPNNVGLLGPISEKTRLFMFALADVALNPMYSGSGSNIKMFDYMAMGVPIISSSFGARGISDISTFHIADTAVEIANEIEKNNIKQEEYNVSRARELVETQYDWSILANNVKELINEYIY